MAGTTQTTDAANERQRAREQRGIRSNQRVRAENTRLPSPPRQRRPALAALAVLLIVGGAAIAALLAMRVDERTPVLQAARTIPAGQQITEDDLTTVQVASELDSLIPESDRDALIGRYATVRINQDQLFDTTMVTEQGGLQEGQVAVGAVLSAGFLPAGGLQPGDVVDLVSIVTGEGETIVEDARVSGVYSAEGGDAPANGANGATVTFIISREDEAEVAGLAATNQLVVTLVERGRPLGAEEE